MGRPFFFRSGENGITRASPAALPFTRTRRQSAAALAVLVACLVWVVAVSTIRMLGWWPWVTGMVPLAG